MTRPLQAIINQASLLHNLTLIKSLTKNKEIIAMVKANAYGHGFDFLKEIPVDYIDYYGVASIGEAKQLLKLKVMNKIILMEGFFIEQELDYINVNNLKNIYLVIHNLLQVETILSFIELNKHNIQIKYNIWIKVNTGMNRLGFSKDQVLDQIYPLLKKSNKINIIGFMTHFSKANEINHSKSIKQVNMFNDFIHKLSKISNNKYKFSASNSGAILELSTAWYDVVRPGILLYGVSPFADLDSSHYGFLPVMTLKTEIIDIKLVKKGETVGYSDRFICDRDRTIAIIAVGYGDGYPQSTPDGTPVLVNGLEAKIFGKVSMDLASIDITELSNINIGDSVTLWGDKLPIEKVARYMQFSTYELLSRVTARVARKINVTSNY